jgi:hypothetical protein
VHAQESIHKRAYLSTGVTSSVGTGRSGSSGGVILEVLRGLIQDPASELPRIPILGTSVNKAASDILAFAGCLVLTEVASTL